PVYSVPQSMPRTRSQRKFTAALPTPLLAFSSQQLSEVITWLIKVTARETCLVPWRRQALIKLFSRKARVIGLERTPASLPFAQQRRVLWRERRGRRSLGRCEVFGGRDPSPCGEQY